MVGNALKFKTERKTAAGPHLQRRNGARVRLYVEDNGIGISPAHQNRIWGMFERIPSRSAYEGTGIGLAIVRKAVERMGGKVGVESDGKSGSKFWIEVSAPPHTMSDF